jgi:hypothetical protein
MTDYFSREEILGAQDIQYEDIPVPEWGNKFVRVKSLNGEERDEVEASMTKMRGNKPELNMQNMRAKLLVRSCVDGDGKRLFSSDGDVLALTKKSAAALNRLFIVAQRLSGITAEDVEELTKNSEEGKSDGSGSD